MSLDIRSAAWKASRSLLAWILAVTLVIPASASESQKPHAMTLEELKAAYPGAIFLQVTPEEFETYRRLYAGNNVFAPNQPMPLVDPLPDPPKPTPSSSPSPSTILVPVSAPDGEHSPPSYSGNGSSGGFGQIFSGWGSGSSGSSGKAAIIIFVIIGAFVVIAAAVYLADFMALAATGKLGDGSLAHWWELGLQTAVFGDASTDYSRIGNLVGIHVSKGIAHNRSHWGFDSEWGYASVRVNATNGDTPINTNGFYGMVGPKVDFPLTGKSRFVEDTFFTLRWILGGATNIGFLSSADVGVNFGLGGGARIGVAAGAVLLGLPMSANEQSELTSFCYTGSVRVGWEF